VEGEKKRGADLPEECQTASSAPVLSTYRCTHFLFYDRKKDRRMPGILSMLQPFLMICCRIKCPRCYACAERSLAPSCV